MDITKIVTIIGFVAVFAVLFFIYYKTKKPLKYFILHALTGAITLVTINLLSIFTSVYLPFNIFNISSTLLMGLPGVITLLIFKVM